MFLTSDISTERVLAMRVLCSGPTEKWTVSTEGPSLVSPGVGAFLWGSAQWGAPTFGSEPTGERQSNGAWFGRMDMTIGDAVDRLAGLARRIIILDLTGLRVEEIEHIELQPHAVVETVAGAGIEDQ